MQLLYRFLIGGLVVSLFALAGDLLRPKSFAGLFGAAPSVAIATLGLTVWQKGNTYASIEARSMMIGAAALLLYAWLCMRLLWRGKYSAVKVTVPGLAFWVLIAIVGWLLILRG